MPKRVATVFVLFLLLLISAFGLRFTSANPYDGQERYLEPPIILIQSPLNQTHATDVVINFSIVSPESWLSTPVSFSYEIGSGLAQKLLTVTYSIDEKIYESFSLDSNLSSPFNYSTRLGNLSVGEHKLRIWTNATGVVRDWISDEVYSVPISSVTLVNFAIDSNISEDTSQNIGVLAVSVSSVAVVVALAFMVYWKKRKEKAKQ